MNPPEPIPPRAFTLYTPAVIGVLSGVLAGLSGGAGSGWPEQVGSRLLVGGFGFLFSWPFVMGAFHGYCFLRGFFGGHHPLPIDCA